MHLPKPTNRTIRIGALPLRTLGVPCILALVLVASCADLIAPIDPVVATCSADNETCPVGFFCTDGLCLRSSVARCGDGVVQAETTEECDDGNHDSNDRCANCRVTYCGDGVAQHGAEEECDDGNRIDTDVCTADCAWARCGDGIERSDTRSEAAHHEECDDGNTTDHDRCTNDCLVARCGDGWLLEGVEFCDDGNEIDDDDCSNTCGLGIVEVAAGLEHACARTESGRVQCWGTNIYGQLGDGSRMDRLSPVLVPGLDRVRRIVLNHRTSCALRDDDSLWCWGLDAGLVPTRFGDQRRWMDVGSYTRTERQRIFALDFEGRLFQVTPGAATMMLTSELMQALDGGENHACTLAHSGRVYCFGAGSRGQLGVQGHPLDAPVYSGIDQVTDVAALASRTCAVTEQRELYCWGDTFGPFERTWTPTLWPDLPPVASISGNRDALVVRLASGEFYKADRIEAVHDSGYYGEINEDDALYRAFMPDNSPPDYTTLLSATANQFLYCAVNDKRRVACWGNGRHGRLGFNLSSYHPRPIRVPNLGPVEEVAVGFQHSCARLSGGTVRCWGEDGLDQRGSRVAFPAKTAPSVVHGLHNAQTLTVGHQVSCALKTDRTATCWGLLEEGRADPPLGYSLINSGSPRWQKLDAGARSLCGIDDQGILSCWGNNDQGQLGDGTRESRSEPAPVLGLRQVASLSSSGSHRCARDQQGMVWCWGGNEFGESGARVQGHPRWVGEPQLMAELGPTTVVSAEFNRTCAVTTDGRSICWGKNCHTQQSFALGVPVTEEDPSNSSLNPIEGLSALPTKFVGGHCWSCALLENREVQCWGYGLLGVLGNGTSVDRNEPTPVVDLPPVRQIDGGHMHTCVVTENDQVYCWGQNETYQIAPPSHNLPAKKGFLWVPTELPLY